MQDGALCYMREAHLRRLQAASLPLQDTLPRTNYSEGGQILSVRDWETSQRKGKQQRGSTWAFSGVMDWACALVTVVVT